MRLFLSLFLMIWFVLDGGDFMLVENNTNLLFHIYLERKLWKRIVWETLYKFLISSDREYIHFHLFAIFCYQVIMFFVSLLHFSTKFLISILQLHIFLSFVLNSSDWIFTIESWRYSIPIVHMKTWSYQSYIVGWIDSNPLLI